MNRVSRVTLDYRVKVDYRVRTDCPVKMDCLVNRVNNGGDGGDILHVLTGR